MPKIGIIGGSGLYHMDALENRREVRLETPWGEPSDSYIQGTIAGREVVFLARHGRGHRINPSNLPFRANIYGFKELGVEWLLSFSAVGSLREELAPLDFVIPDQFFDRTKGRPSTFFDEDVVVHVAFAHPVCKTLGDVAEAACRKVGVKVSRGGTYCCMEGPQFSTLAESNFHRACGFDVIGMTNLQEAKLAREAEMSYATVAMVTDYDCWHEEHDAVTVEQVIEYLTKNAANAQAVAIEAVQNIPDGPSPFANALSNSILTDRSKISDASRAKYARLIGKYL
ncbi:MAG: S-methyl-5'-thioadenosine phosphorylase [Acidobacteria bacterium]|nr:S-methyl-5'-thioadenosine phosphorylase [Acidobacteriota bacterium]